MYISLVTLGVLGLAALTRDLLSTTSENCLSELDQRTSLLGSQSMNTYSTEFLEDGLQDKEISIITSVIGGSGDYMFAGKLALHLQNTLHVGSDKIRVGLDSFSQKDLLEGCRSLSKMGIRCSSIDNKVFAADIIIAGPAITRDLKSIMEYFPSRSFLAIHEAGATKRDYETTNIHPYYLGLDSDSIGILLSPELMEWSSSPKTELERLEKLESIPDELQIEILGDRYSQIRAESFSQNSKLYFGYAHQPPSMLNFIEAIASTERESNLCFYFMGSGVPYFAESDTERLRSYGIGEIEYVNTETASRNTVQISETGKHVKIIAGPLNPSHVKYMHMASEPATLATGDQSFFEGISCGKIPTYETQLHKQIFFRQIQNILPEELAQFYSRPNDEFDINQMRQFFLKCKSNPELVTSVIDKIKSDFNFLNKFNMLLEKIFLSQEVSI